MKVVCKKTSLVGLELEEIIGENKVPVCYSPVNMDNLQIGSEYIIMGMGLYRSPYCLYYLLDVNGDYPHWHPYSLFNIIDNSFPSTWSVKVFSRLDNQNIHAIWGFYELNNDTNFYDQLIDSEKNAANIYFKRKHAIMLELYPELMDKYDLTSQLIILEKNLVMCYNCEHAWDINNSYNRGVECPKCTQVYINPYYITR